MSIVAKMIKTYHLVYNKSRIKTVDTILGEENFFREECTFFDDGRVKAGIDRIQEDCQKLDTEISFVKKERKDDSDYQERLNYLYKRKYELILLMVYQASQGKKNIDSSLQILQNMPTNFKQALLGLKSYYDGKEEEAVQILTTYRENERFDNHFLLNKVYGLMLQEKGRIQEALSYLKKAAQSCPEDIEVHSHLKDIYELKKDEKDYQREKDILELLEC